MLKKIILCFVFLNLTFLSAQSKSDDNLSMVNDGPYVFIEDDRLVEKNVVNGVLKTKDLKIDAYETTFKPEVSVYKDVEQIVALSDIHGQFDLAVEILKNNKVIDDDLNWVFGKGHLVIVGDIFDRGPKVTETLWFVYKLEKQAKAHGGKVHFLLGNHEFMVLHDDLRYIHKKYQEASKILKLRYSQLFDANTVLGKWLRSKNTMVKINDNVFVHGGISPDFLLEDFDIEVTNKLMRNSIDRDKTEMRSTDFYDRFYGQNGPIWYRGYFYDGLKDDDISKILNQISANHVIVGHCSQKEVLQLYDKKILAVDSSIKKGKYGEVLWIDAESYSRGTKDGKKIKL
ncbi:metallophosphoesterase [uncultured Psychroserpens sp.]|uniref:metallophosphoesterase n=1 Tax=uncultured Psychroserpens sp. TaxID=255436 RepID=UPI0026091EB6|nr:metallophosphoesterase [uncultured Psychroserpens sp.]